MKDTIDVVYFADASRSSHRYGNICMYNTKIQQCRPLGIAGARETFSERTLHVICTMALLVPCPTSFTHPLVESIAARSPLLSMFRLIR